MKATDILMSEHQVILRMITALEKATDLLEDGRAVPPEIFIEASDFIKGFADGCHHKKEEGVLFKSHGRAWDAGVRRAGSGHRWQNTRQAAPLHPGNAGRSAKTGSGRRIGGPRSHPQCTRLCRFADPAHRQREPDFVPDGR